MYTAQVQNDRLLILGRAVYMHRRLVQCRYGRRDKLYLCLWCVCVCVCVCGTHGSLRSSGWISKSLESPATSRRQIQLSQLGHPPRAHTQTCVHWSSSTVAPMHRGLFPAEAGPQLCPAWERDRVILRLASRPNCLLKPSRPPPPASWCNSSARARGAFTREFSRYIEGEAVLTPSRGGGGGCLTQGHMYFLAGRRQEKRQARRFDGLERILSTTRLTVHWSLSASPRCRKTRLCVCVCCGSWIRRRRVRWPTAGLNREFNQCVCVCVCVSGRGTISYVIHFIYTYSIYTSLQQTYKCCSYLSCCYACTLYSKIIKRRRQ